MKASPSWPGRAWVLRRFHSDDVAAFVAYRSDAQVVRFQSWDAPYPRESERFIREYQAVFVGTLLAIPQTALGRGSRREHRTPRLQALGCQIKELQ